MAIVDNNLILSGSITAAGVISYQTPATTGSTLSTNTVDLGIARDIGEGFDQYLRVLVGTAFAGGTSTEFQIIVADDAALTSNVTVIGSTGAIPTASLTAGARFAAELNPRIASKGQRYLGARMVVVGTNTGGTAFIDLGMEIQDGQKFYASGFAIK
jgi:hypothetical protein